MKKNKIINVLLFCAVVIVSVLPMFLFWSSIQITKYSIPAICLLVFHLLYGFLAYYFRHKGNFLLFKHIFFRHFLFNFVEPDKDYTFTKEYEHRFYQMLAVYYAVVPMYIPCIFLTSTIAAMPIAACVFLLPQILFIFTEIRGFSSDIKETKQKKQLQKQELKEQQKREEMGHFK